MAIRAAVVIDPGVLAHAFELDTEVKAVLATLGDMRPTIAALDRHALSRIAQRLERRLCEPFGPRHGAHDRAETGVLLETSRRDPSGFVQRPEQTHQLTPVTLVPSACLMDRSVKINEVVGDVRGVCPPGCCLVLGRHVSWFTDNVAGQPRSRYRRLPRATRAGPMWREITADFGLRSAPRSHAKIRVELQRAVAAQIGSRCAALAGVQGLDVFAYFDNDARRTRVRNALAFARLIAGRRRCQDAGHPQGLRCQCPPRCGGPDRFLSEGYC